MNLTLADIKRQLSKIKPWVGAAVVLGVVLLGYYGMLGMRYLGVTEEVSSLEEEIRITQAALRQQPADNESLEAERDLQEKRLSAVRTLSNSLHSDDLVGILAATARETDVYLSRIGIGDPKSELLDDVRYRTQPMSLTLAGEMLDIFEFLSSVQKKVPLTRVPTINISSPAVDPSAQVQMVFFLSPEIK